MSAKVLALVLSALVAGVCPALAQDSVMVEDRPALKFQGKITDSGVPGITFVKKVVRQKEPSVEFPVAYWKQIATGRGGWCGGSLFVSRERIAFKPSATTNKSACDNAYFDSTRSDVSVSFTKDTARVVLPSTMYEFRMRCRLWLEEIDRVCDEPDPHPFFNFLELSLVDFEKALARIQSPFQGAPKEPAPLETAPPSAQSPPIIRVFNPYLPSGEKLAVIREGPLSVRGIVIHAGGVPQVTVKGQPARVAAISDNVAEFEAIALILEPNLNVIPVFAIATDKVESTFTLLVFQPAAVAGSSRKVRLSLQNIEEALKAGVTESEVNNLAKQYGVDFALTDDVEARLRAAGATAELLLTISRMRAGP